MTEATVTKPRTGKPVVGGSIFVAGCLLATALIMPNEGKRNVGYYDPSHIPTACWGRTKGVVVGQRYDDATCKAWLTADVQEHAAPLARCITAPVTAETFGALVDISYNAGPTTVCKNFAPLINAGRTKDACAKLSLYVYSRDRKTGQMVKLPGLVKRRAQERALCEKGL